MSTRCNIIVKDGEEEVQLYRHMDGYPAGEHGVIAHLPQVLQFAWPLPRMKVPDMAAAIVRAWKESGGNIYIDSRYDELHGDIEFLYVIKPDKSFGNWKVEVYEMDFSKKDPVWQGHIGNEFPEDV